MAKAPLFDVDVYKPNRALGAVLAGRSGNLRTGMSLLGEKVGLLYSAKVAQKTGQLSRSPKVSVERGGHRNDRMVLEVAVGGSRAKSLFKGKPFYYGVLHDLGASKAKKEQYPGAKDLREVIREISQ